ncbi:DUF1835 domain-containing protein [Paenibacillus sp. WQ 127069]|uniref:DUF1835 domain-containing protein n=1 Tax=Paenibacillus baimaensis TaxID=2982185 RepID=A0ABT2U7P6_9BACL|nr:DUF1835 domain-containing protein [Paenibacillus sp. WQ 127069]MCU6790649.1 DUF1835 domain-containing protein [Paenibacillus sp. WQ 127069]
MAEYQEMLRELQEWETRDILNDLLQIAEQSATKWNEEIILADRILKLWKDRLEKSRKGREEAEERQDSVHLVFSLSDAGSLKVTISELGMRQKIKVMAFNELFSIGPIMNLETPEGQRRRQQWIMERFSYFTYANLHNSDHQIGRMIKTILTIPERKSITIWFGNNAHDLVGLHFALYLLRNREQPIQIINLTEAYKKFAMDDEGNAQPYAQGLIAPEIYKEIVKHYENTRPLDSIQRRYYESNWLEKLSKQEHTLRFWQDGKIVGMAEEELDGIIISSVLKLQNEETADGFVRAGHVVAEVFENMFQLVGDQFVEYRMWRLISDGILSFRGLPNAMFQYSVKVNN